MGEGERRGACFLFASAAPRGEGADRHWRTGVFCTLTRAARGLRKMATRVPPDLSRKKAGEVTE